MTDPQNKPSQIGFDSLEWQKRLSILEEEVSNLSAANFNGFIEEDLIEIDGIGQSRIIGPVEKRGNHVTTPRRSRAYPMR